MITDDAPNLPSFATLDRVRIRAFAGVACCGARMTLRGVERDVGMLIVSSLALGLTSGSVLAVTDGIAVGFGWFLAPEPEPPPNAVTPPPSFPNWNPTVESA